MLPFILSNLRTFSTAGTIWPRNQCPLVFADQCQHPTDSSKGWQRGWDQPLGHCKEQTCGHTSKAEKNRPTSKEGFSADSTAETGFTGTWGSQLVQQESAISFLCRYCWERNSSGGLFCLCYAGLSDPSANLQRWRSLSISHIPASTDSTGENLGFIAPSCKTAPPFSVVWGACQREAKKGATFACGPHIHKSGWPKLQVARLIWNGRGEVDFCV